MKKIIFIAATCLFSSQLLQAQISKTTLRQDNTLSYGVRREVNVAYYNIEASNDRIHFEIVRSISPKGNSVLPSEYTVALWSTGYRYFRIRQVKINRECFYSDIVETGGRDCVPGIAAGDIVSSVGKTR